MFEKIYKWAETANVDNFTSNFGLWFRRKEHKLNRYINKFIHEKILKYNLIIDRKIQLEKNKSYIFASNHYFYYDILSIISSVDRNSYILSGGLRTIPKIFLFTGWINGGIYVNRCNKEKRKESLKKMSRVLNAGNSIIIYPEGVFNNDESRLCLKLYSGAYNLSLQNQVEVVPISIFKDDVNKKIFISYGKPLKLYDYEKDKGLEILRDNIATLLYEQIEKHSIHFDRTKVKGDIHFNYMNKRIKEYIGDGWKDTPVWEAELAEYKGNDVELEDVWKDIDKVKIDKNNINIFADILVELEKRKKYNFKNYIINNYNKNSDNKFN